MLLWGAATVGKTEFEFGMNDDEFEFAESFCTEDFCEYFKPSDLMTIKLGYHSK